MSTQASNQLAGATEKSLVEMVDVTLRAHDTSATVSLVSLARQMQRSISESGFQEVSAASRIGLVISPASQRANVQHQTA